MSARTIQRARETLPPEYGHELVNESGRETLLVRVPKAKPDYLNDLAEVAFYVAEDTIRNTKDILLVGDEKTSRLEPQRLRDHIRAQRREDAEVVDAVRGQLDRTYGQTIHRSPSNYEHHALVLRIPKRTVNEFSPDDVVALRHVLHTNGNRFDDCQYGYIIADTDHERLGKRTLVELAGATPDAEPMAESEADFDADSPVEAEEHFTPETLDVSAHAPAKAAAESPPELAPWPDHGGSLPPTAKPTNAPETMPLPSDETEEYEIISRPAKAPAAPSAPVSPSGPAPAPVAMPSAPVGVGVDDVDDKETYEIISRPTVKPAPSAPAAAPAAQDLAPDAAPVEESSHASAPAPAPVPVPASAPPMASAPARKTSTGLQPALSTGKADVVTEEYEVVSRKPTPPPAPPVTAPPAHSPTPGPASAPLAQPSPSAGSRAEPGYEIISTPRRAEPERAPPAPAPAAAPAPAPVDTVTTRTKGYEIMSSRAPAPETRIPQLQRNAAAPAASSPAHPTFGAAPLTTIRDEGRAASRRMGVVPSSLPTSTTLPATDAYTPPAAVAPTPPVAPAVVPPVPVVESAPAVVEPVAPSPPEEPVAVALPAAAVVPEVELAPVELEAPVPMPPAPAPAPVAEPVAALPTTPAPEPAAPGVRAAEAAEPAPAADPMAVLADHFRGLGYELVEGIKAQGHAFAFAAHATSGGRRVLVTKAEAFSVADVRRLADIVTALGADIGLVVADRVESGARLASWGTPVQVIAPAEVERLTF